jgi:hypothetical protein
LTQLQARLNHLRQDLRPAGLDVTLDIVDLKPGMGIDEFMKQGVTTAEVIFLVGTPDYLRRVPEPKNEVRDCAVACASSEAHQLQDMCDLAALVLSPPSIPRLQLRS